MCSWHKKIGDWDSEWSYHWLQLKVSREDKSVRLWPMCNIEYDSPSCLWLQEDMYLWSPSMTECENSPNISECHGGWVRQDPRTTIFFSLLSCLTRTQTFSNYRVWLSVSVSLKCTYPCRVFIHGFYVWCLTLVVFDSNSCSHTPLSKNTLSVEL